jgi:hypothetical protein
MRQKQNIVLAHAKHAGHLPMVRCSVRITGKMLFKSVMSSRKRLKSHELTWNDGRIRDVRPQRVGRIAQDSSHKRLCDYICTLHACVCVVDRVESRDRRVAEFRILSDDVVKVVDVSHGCVARGDLRISYEARRAEANRVWVIWRLGGHDDVRAEGLEGVDRVFNVPTPTHQHQHRLQRARTNFSQVNTV